jgi:hypothetical protein
MSKEKSKFSKQMFTVKCTVTGEEKKVRRSVFMSRVGRVQRLARHISGEQITVADAINALNESYVGIAGRKQEECDFLGQPIMFAQAMALKPKRVRKAKVAAVAATPAPAAPAPATPFVAVPAVATV